MIRRGIAYLGSYQTGCPCCGAPAGEPCTDRETGDRVRTHRERIEAIRTVTARIGGAS